MIHSYNDPTIWSPPLMAHRLTTLLNNNPPNNPFSSDTIECPHRDTLSPGVDLLCCPTCPLIICYKTRIHNRTVPWQNMPKWSRTRRNLSAHKKVPGSSKGCASIVSSQCQRNIPERVAAKTKKSRRHKYRNKIIKLPVVCRYGCCQGWTIFGCSYFFEREWLLQIGPGFK